MRLEELKKKKVKKLDATVFKWLEKKLKKIPEIKMQVSGEKFHITGPSDIDIDGELYIDDHSGKTWVNFATSDMSGNDPADEFYRTVLRNIVRNYEGLWWDQPNLYTTSPPETQQKNDKYWKEMGMSRKHCYKVLEYLDKKRKLSSEPPFGKKLPHW